MSSLRKWKVAAKRKTKGKQKENSFGQKQRIQIAGRILSIKPRIGLNHDCIGWGTSQYAELLNMTWSNIHNSNARILQRKPVGSDLSGIEIEYGFRQIPPGRCLIGLSRARICYLAFAPIGTDAEMVNDLAARWPGAGLRLNQTAIEGIAGAFGGKDSQAGDIDLLVRGTDFQMQAWEALLRIPCGETRTYAQLAQSIGQLRAVRAVGTAVGANLIAWLIPCHRVVRSDGGLGDYRWGIPAKEACLRLEKLASSKL